MLAIIISRLLRNSHNQISKLHGENIFFFLHSKFERIKKFLDESIKFSICSKVKTISAPFYGLIYFIRLNIVKVVNTFIHNSKTAPRYSISK